MQFRIKPLGIVLGALGITSAFLAFKTSNEPVIGIFERTSIESLFQKWPTGNEIVFNISIGFIVSILFYAMVVWLPDRKKKFIIKQNMADQYQSFKEETISIFLAAGQNCYDSGLPSRLSQQVEFRNYFKESVGNSQNRWGIVLNGLTDKLLNDILIELEILLKEVSYVLNNVNIEDPDVFMFFKRLSQAVYRLKNTSLDYDEVKHLSKFLWEIFAGWSFIDGYREDDIVAVMISKI